MATDSRCDGIADLNRGGPVLIDCGIADVVGRYCCFDGFVISTAVSLRWLVVVLLMLRGR